MVAKFLQGKKVYLRAYEDGDVPFLHYGKNSESIRETLFLYAPQTAYQTRAELLSLVERDDVRLFVICAQEGDVVLGYTALMRIDFVSRSAIFFITLSHEEHKGRGYGGEAVALMMSYAFDVINLNRVQLHVSSENVLGIAAYRNAGFVMEGTLREAMYLHDRYVDFHVMSLLRSEYYPRK